MINRQDILSKTCYGLNLYSHVILLGRKVEEGLRVSFPDCGLWPNPFDDYRRSLHITVVKQHPDKKLSNYIAIHHDESGHIPDGNAIDFAGLYFNLQNQPLLEKINKDLYLHIGEDYNPYKRDRQVAVPEPAVEEPESMQDLPEDNPGTTGGQPLCAPSHIIAAETTTPESPLMSFFNAPIWNKYPSRELTLSECYAYIVSDTAKAATEKLRAFTDKDKAKKFKASSFNYVTPGGTFTFRDAANIKQASGYIVMDIDDLPDAAAVEAAFTLLLDNRRLETLLLFRSPSGHGLKWIVPVVNNAGHTFAFYWSAVANYLKSFGIVADPSGKDICRACFLPHDPRAFLNPKYL